jgi:RIO kinase 1
VPRDPVDSSATGEERQRIVEEMERKLQTALSRSSDQEPEDLEKTMDEVFDESTLLTLYKMLTEGVVESLDYPVSTGKEANVFHATAPGGDAVALKIFRVNTATFRSFMQYLEGDPRFRDVGPNRRDVVHAWTRKEFRNLETAREAGAPVPEPIAFRNNVLALSFVGAHGTPAPMLRDAPPRDTEAAAFTYERLVDVYADVVAEADLVHGDLSEYNVLRRPGAAPEDQLVVIDWAQAVVTDHPMAAELLERDAGNIARFLSSKGADVDEDETLEGITAELDEADQDELLDEVVP